jgi:hypothetical protein
MKYNNEVKTCSLLEKELVGLRMNPNSKGSSRTTLGVELETEVIKKSSTNTQTSSGRKVTEQDEIQKIFYKTPESNK